MHVLVDLLALTLLLAVPAATTVVAMAVAPRAAQVPLLPAAALTLAWCVVLLGFTVVWPWLDGGRTAGMRWAGVKVVRRDGRPPTGGQLLLRAVVLPVDVVLGPLLLVRADRRRLGDLLARTQVVSDLSAATVTAGRPGTARSPRRRSSRAAAPPPD